MSFRLVPNSVTLNDLERRSNINGCLISPNSVPFWVDYIKVVDTPIFLRQKCRPQNLVLATYHLRRYWQGITPSASDKVRHSSLAGENLTII